MTIGIKKARARLNNKQKQQL